MNSNQNTNQKSGLEQVQNWGKSSNKKTCSAVAMGDINNKKVRATSSEAYESHTTGSGGSGQKSNDSKHHQSKHRRFTSISTDESDQDCRMEKFDQVKGLRYIEDINAIYQFKKKLGAGACGQVYRAVNRETQNKCAIKVIAKQGILESDDRVDMLLNELQILDSQLDHQNVTQVLDLLHDSERFYIVFELIVDGDGFAFLERYYQHCGGPLTEKLAKEFAKQILQGLQFIHSKKIMHRDVKLENLLVQIKSKDEICVKLTDFGMSSYIQDTDVNMRIQAGSSSYMAPEVLSWGLLTEKSDIWSTGVVLYVLMQGKFPFDGESFKQIHGSIKKKNLKEEWQSARWSKISDDAKDFLDLCFMMEPKSRPSCSDLLNHPWLQNEKKAKSTAAASKKITIEGIVSKLLAGENVPAAELQTVKEAMIQLDSRILNIKDIFSFQSKDQSMGMQEQLRTFFKLLSFEELSYIIQLLEHTASSQQRRN